MLGAIIGGLVVGGLISSCVSDNRSRRSSVERTSHERTHSSCTQSYRASRTQTRSQQSKPVVITKTVVKEVTNQKLERQVTFYDEFRELDNKLARNIGKGYKGVTYLIKGLEVTDANYSLRRSLKNIKNYRGQLSHDKRKWKDIPAPSESIMSDLRRAKDWVYYNSSLAGKLVYKGNKAFSSNY